MPHYKQVRAFHIDPEPFSIENGLLTANGKLKRDVIAAQFAGRDRRDVPGEAGGLALADGMKRFKAQALSWELNDGVVELALHREPCNEIGSLTLDELEEFVAALRALPRTRRMR